MSFRAHLKAVRRVLIGLIFGLLASAGVNPATAAAYTPPRNASGAPDLEGIWTNSSLTRLERPAAYRGLIATDAEAEKARTRWLSALAPPAPEIGTPASRDSGDVGQETAEFPDRDVNLTRIGGQYRTSVIVAPADGRLPYTRSGRQRVDDATAKDNRNFDGPEARSAAERCLVAPNGAVGPPMLSGPDNANYQIVQTPREIAILSEMVHDVRIVRMGGRHPQVRTHPWAGDSIGRWEGDTLVIETVDQNPLSAARFVGPTALWISPAAVVTERLRRISATELLYSFEVDDPAIYTQPWRGEMIFNAAKSPIYEFACHEGNYALANILAGARETERGDLAGKPVARP